MPKIWFRLHLQHWNLSPITKRRPVPPADSFFELLPPAAQSDLCLGGPPRTSQPQGESVPMVRQKDHPRVPSGMGLVDGIEGKQGAA